MSILSCTGNTSNTYIVYTHSYHTYTYITHTHIPHPIREWNTHTFTHISHVYTIRTPLPPRMGINNNTHILFSFPFFHEWIQNISTRIPFTLLPLRMDTTYNVGNNSANTSFKSLHTINSIKNL